MTTLNTCEPPQKVAETLISSLSRLPPCKEGCSCLTGILAKAIVKYVLKESSMKQTIIAGNQRLYPTYLDYLSAKIKSGHVFRISKEEEFKGLFRRSIRQVIFHINALHFRGADRILELGAGKPEKNGRSFLSNLFPEETGRRIISTDVNPTIVAEAQSLNKNYRRVDASNISSTFPGPCFDKIIAASVLDTLTPVELTKTLAEAKKALVDGGLLIQFSYMMPFLNTIVSAHISEDTLIFPHTHEGHPLVGLQIIDKKTYFNQIRPQIINKVSAPEIEFLDWYAKLNLHEKEYIFQHFIGKGQTVAFSEWIKLIIPREYVRIVNNNIFFEKRIRNAVRSCGLELIDMGIVTEQQCDQTGVKGDNLFINNFGHEESYHCYVLAPGMLMTVSKVHVLIAKKIPKKEPAIS